MTKEFRNKVVAAVKRAESGVNNLLAVLSIAAVALVVSSEFIAPGYTIPYLNWTWAGVQVGTRAMIWLAFIASFAVYAVISKQPVQYLKSHVLEFVICVTWVPHYADGPFTIVNDIFVLSRFVPLDALQLLGALAHAWRVLRWTAGRFPAHPIYVTGSAATLLIFTSAALLNHFEPETFHTFWDGAWFSLTTVTTIGYGDLTPKTGIGRIITTGLIVCGISIFGVVIGLATELVRTKLLKQESNPEVAALRLKVRKLMLEHGETQKLVGRLETQNQRIEAQSTEMLGLLRKLAEEKDIASAEANLAKSAEQPGDQATAQSGNQVIGQPGEDAKDVTGKDEEPSSHS